MPLFLWSQWEKCHPHLKSVVKCFFGDTPPTAHSPISEFFFTFCRVIAQYFAFLFSPVLFLLVCHPLLCLSEKMQRKFRFMKNENEYQEVSSSGKQILHGRNAARSRGRWSVQGCLGTTANDCPFMSTLVRAANKAEVPGSRSHDLWAYRREFNLLQFVSACFSHEDKRQTFKSHCSFAPGKCS